MILGIFLAIGVAGIIALAGMGIYEECCLESWAEKLTATLTIVLILGVLIGGAVVGKSLENARIEKEYYGFIAVKETYDAAISNDKISGLERLEVTKTVIDQNKALARRKVDMGKWYSFAITDENKELIIGLQLIGIQ